MPPYIVYFLRKGTDWLFRRRSLGLMIIRAGLVLLALGLGGLTFRLTTQNLSFNFETGQAVPAIATWGLIAIGIGLIVVGCVMVVIESVQEQRSVSRKLVVAIEGRGLRDGPGRALVEDVPESLQGARREILLDLRQKLMDGVVVDPESILPKLINVNTLLDQVTAGKERRDVSVVYSGMASVPFTFLTGLLLDDEGYILVMDWDRRILRWRELDEEDDGKRFEISGEDKILTSTEAVVAVSVSYPINDSDLEETFHDRPIVRATLDSGSPHAHWSALKQAALADQFLRLMIAISGKGVRRVHLVLAAPNSMVFTLGRCYDKRNLPRISVYQFERDSHPPYPWSVDMPVAGQLEAGVIQTSASP